jgi:hypothetical protein
LPSERAATCWALSFSIDNSLLGVSSPTGKNYTHHVNQMMLTKKLKKIGGNKPTDYLRFKTEQEFIDNTVTLTLTTNDPVGPCPAVDANVTITFANPATSTVSPDLTICEGESVNVSGTFGGAASSASWVYFSENGSTPGIILPNANAKKLVETTSISNLIVLFASEGLLVVFS